jgi:hypothetical protein
MTSCPKDYIDPQIPWPPILSSHVLILKHFAMRLMHAALSGLRINSYSWFSAVGLQLPAHLTVCGVGFLMLLNGTSLCASLLGRHNFTVFYTYLSHSLTRVERLIDLRLSGLRSIVNRILPLKKFSMALGLR